MVTEHSATGINTGDLIATVFMLGLVVVPIFIGIVFYVSYKAARKRANGRLELEQERTLNLQKQVDVLERRVTKMEQLLRENK